LTTKIVTVGLDGAAHAVPTAIVRSETLRSSAKTRRKRRDEPKVKPPPGGVGDGADHRAQGPGSIGGVQGSRTSRVRRVVRLGTDANPVILLISSVVVGQVWMLEQRRT
jgi:hypothetical protein